MPYKIEQPPDGWTRHNYIENTHKNRLSLQLRQAPGIFTDLEVYHFGSSSSYTIHSVPFERGLYGIDVYAVRSTKGSPSWMVIAFIEPGSWAARLLKSAGGWQHITTLWAYEALPMGGEGTDKMLEEVYIQIALWVEDLYHRCKQRDGGQLDAFVKIVVPWIRLWHMGRFVGVRDGQRVFNLGQGGPYKV